MCHLWIWCRFISTYSHVYLSYECSGQIFCVFSSYTRPCQCNSVFVFGFVFTCVSTSMQSERENEPARETDILMPMVFLLSSPVCKSSNHQFMICFTSFKCSFFIFGCLFFARYLPLSLHFAVRVFIFYFWFVDLLFHSVAAAAIYCWLSASSTCVFISIFSYLMRASARPPIFRFDFILACFPVYFTRVWIRLKNFICCTSHCRIIMHFIWSLYVYRSQRFNFSNIWSASPARNSCSP